MARLGHPIGGPAAWRGSELHDRDDFKVDLSDAHKELDELEAALARLGDTPLGEIDRASFALPRLGSRLASVQHHLEHGSGAALLQGLPYEGRDEDDLARLFWGLARHIGTPVSQSAAGGRLLHVRDEAFGAMDPRLRGPHTNKRLHFHTDRCDVIAFLCVRPAATGGENHLLSSITLHDELVRRAPDVIPRLNQPFAYLRHTVDGGNQRPFTELPVLTVHEQRFAASFLRVLIDRADADPRAPDLDPSGRRALDMLETVAEDPELYASLRLEPGDMLLLNNWVILHRRTAFEDHLDRESARHLMRLWLAVPNSRALDPRFADHFGSTDAGAVRGGMQPR